MHDLYNFVTGPLAWAAFIVFIAGSLYRLINMLYLVNKKEKFIFTYMSFKYSFRSIFHWITPFATVNYPTLSSGMNPGVSAYGHCRMV